MEISKRIIGFDLARAYAIFGMYIVNFNIVFGNYYDASLPGKFLSDFSGNSSTTFVMLAGMGIAIMSNRTNFTTEEKRNLRKKINKRALFLFVLGVLFCLWWPADILHFYGGYMYFAAFLLFVDKKYYLLLAALAIFIFHCLIILIPYQTGWNFDKLQYIDFWTVNGFIRNTFYNGWNSVFPWLAYFTVGMYLGRLNWSSSDTLFRIFVAGLILFGPISVLQMLSYSLPISDDLQFFINADYLPPFLPFILSTTGFGMILIVFFMFLGKFIAQTKIAQYLALTGQMTLTHYISHLTIGMLFFSLLTGMKYEGEMNDHQAVSPLVIFTFSSIYFIISAIFSVLWMRKYKYGPFELLMRKIAG